MRLDFEMFLEQETQNKSKRYSSYLGITRKEYPRWGGWAILRNLDDPSEDCPSLDVLVRNFYYIKYLKSSY